MNDKKPFSIEHKYEIDIIRAITAVTVIAVHTLGSLTHLDSDFTADFIQNAAIATLHFSREIFMFMTAFALVYVYSTRGLQARTFWQKRTMSVVIPYVIWSIIYIMLYGPQASLVSYLYVFGFDVLTGNAYYQLYYILLIIQFYLFFPIFLPLLKRLQNIAPKVILCVFIAQVFIVSWDYFILQMQNMYHASWWANDLIMYQNRFILMYSLYFILGGFCAMHIKTFEAWIRKHTRGIITAFCITSAVFLGGYVTEVTIFHLPTSFASSAMQPLLIPYTTATIILLYLGAHTWVTRFSTVKGFKWMQFWIILSECSFGLYLIHPIILNIMMAQEIPLFPSITPLAVILFGVWVSTVSVSLLISFCLFKLPFVNFLVGKFNPRSMSKEMQKLRSMFPRKDLEYLSEIID